MSELKVIYLGPACQEQGDGREWCQDDVWQPCECGHTSVKFVASTELDRVTAERDALQQRLNAADQRIEEVERDKVRIDWLAEQPVDTLYLDDGRIIDIAGRVDLRDAIDAAMAAPRPADGGGDEN